MQITNDRWRFGGKRSVGNAAAAHPSSGTDRTATMSLTLHPHTTIVPIRSVSTGRDFNLPPLHFNYTYWNVRAPQSAVWCQWSALIVFELIDWCL